MSQSKGSDTIAHDISTTLKAKSLNEEKGEQLCRQVERTEDDRIAKLFTKYMIHRRRELGQPNKIWIRNTLVSYDIVILHDVLSKCETIGYCVIYRRAIRELSVCCWQENKPNRCVIKLKSHNYDWSSCSKNDDDYCGDARVV
jgi:hypothetical protein